MKVISGIYKGRNILGYDLDGTRPTMDRVKESLFAMIQDYIKDAVILDLFSGSGNLGIEALSNGAKEAYLVDYNRKAYSTIKTNIDNLGISNSNVLNMDYKEALTNLSGIDKKFDVIFLDPPYKTNFAEESVKIIEENNLLNEDGIIILETDDKEKVIKNLYTEKLEIKDLKKYGRVYLLFLKFISRKGTE